MCSTLHSQLRNLSQLLDCKQFLLQISRHSRSRYVGPKEGAANIYVDSFFTREHGGPENASKKRCIHTARRGDDKKEKQKSERDVMARREPTS
jgi:hypothetical protein